MGNTKEASMEQTPEGGKRRTGEGWFILNALEGQWHRSEKFGAVLRMEGGVPFPQIGVHLRLLLPGQPNCYYHRETEQEDFLVLSGEALVVIEGQERRLKAWDYVHCPPGTDHVFVGAGDGPCLILMLGARRPEGKIVYPVEAAALKHQAGVEEETDQPRVAYAAQQRPTPVPVPAEVRRVLGGNA